MSDKNTSYFLIFVILIVCYALYQKTAENDKMYKILTDQDDTIELQNQAIQLQQSYIRQLQYSYGINQRTINVWENPIHENPKRIN